MQNPKITPFNPTYKVEVVTDSGMMDVSGHVLRIEVQTTARDTCNKFRVVFVPRENNEDELIYDYLEPMTFMRISFTREQKDNKIPTVIRGFVTRVHKGFEIQNGKPVRTINVVGENYGKIIKMTYIHYLMGLDPAKVFASSGSAYPFLAAYNIDLINGNTTPSMWLQKVYEVFIDRSFNLIQQYMVNRRDDGDKMKHLTSDIVALNMEPFKLDIDEKGVDGTRAPVGIDNPQAFSMVLTDTAAATADTGLYEFINAFFGHPWNELFIDDAPDAAYLVFRPFPYRDREGGWVGSTAFASPDSYTAPEGRKDWFDFKEVKFDEVMSYEFQRSDEDVYNYFFTDASVNGIGVNYEIWSRAKLNNINPHYTVDVNSGGQTAGTQLANSTKKNFSRMEIYGFRKFHKVTPYISLSPMDTEAPETIERFGKTVTISDPSMISVGEQLNAILFNGMEHNSQLESGEIAIRGREDIRPGMYILFRDERIDDYKTHVYYVTDVFHSFVPYENFVTRLIVSRGEGHLDHIPDGLKRY